VDLTGHNSKRANAPPRDARRPEWRIGAGGDGPTWRSSWRAACLCLSPGVERVALVPGGPRRCLVSAQGRAAGRWTHHDGADPQVAVAVKRKAHASGWGVPRGVADVNQNGRQHPPKRALLNDAGSAEPNQCVRVDGLGENNRQDQRAVKRTPPKSCGRATCYMRELGDRGSITGLGHRLCPQRLHPTPLDKATPPIPSQRLDASRTNRHRGGAEGGTQCLKGGCSHCGSLSGAPASLSASCLTLPRRCSARRRTSTSRVPGASEAHGTLECDWVTLPVRFSWPDGVQVRVKRDDEHRPGRLGGEALRSGSFIPGRGAAAMAPCATGPAATSCRKHLLAHRRVRASRVLRSGRPHHTALVRPPLLMKSKQNNPGGRTMRPAATISKPN